MTPVDPSRPVLGSRRTGATVLLVQASSVRPKSASYVSKRGQHKGRTRGLAIRPLDTASLTQV
jgi:hypothetical protein